jgi:hypothetical protein
VLHAAAWRPASLQALMRGCIHCQTTWLQYGNRVHHNLQVPCRMCSLLVAMCGDHCMLVLRCAMLVADL